MVEHSHTCGNKNESNNYCDGQTETSLLSSPPVRFHNRLAIAGQGSSYRNCRRMSSLPFRNQRHLLRRHIFFSLCSRSVQALSDLDG